MSWEVCGITRGRALSGPTVSFMRMRAGLQANIANEVVDWLGGEEAKRVDWFVDGDREMLAIAARPAGRYTLTEGRGRSVRATVNATIARRYREQLLGRHFRAQLGEQPGIGRCAWFSVHQHDAGAAECSRPGPVQMRLGRDRIRGYVRRCVEMGSPINADAVRQYGREAGLPEADAMRTANTAEDEAREAVGRKKAEGGRKNGGSEVRG